MSWNEKIYEIKEYAFSVSVKPLTSKKNSLFCYIISFFYDCCILILYNTKIQKTIQQNVTCILFYLKKNIFVFLYFEFANFKDYCKNNIGVN